MKNCYTSDVTQAGKDVFRLFVVDTTQRAVGELVSSTEIRNNDFQLVRVSEGRCASGSVPQSLLGQFDAYSLTG